MGKDTDDYNERLKVEARDREDFVAAHLGVSNGRNPRYGGELRRNRELQQQERRKETDAEILRLSASYVALYNATMQDLHDTRSIVYDASIQAGVELQNSQTLLRQTLAEANVIANGETVFRSVDGHVYNHKGHQLEHDAVEGIVWREGAPSWEDYQQRLADVEAKQERFDRMNAHEARLAELSEEMEDLKERDTSENAKRMSEIKEEIQEIKEDAQQTHKADFQFKQVKSEQLEPIPIDLGKPAI